MSYILEAIKRSERERLTVNAPGLPVLSAFGEVAKQPPFLRYGAASAALIAAGIAIGWLRPWQPGPVAVAPVIAKVATAPARPVPVADADEGPAHAVSQAPTGVPQKVEVLHVMRVKPYRAPAHVASADPVLAARKTPAAAHRASPAAPAVEGPVAAPRTPATAPIAVAARTAEPEGVALPSQQIADAGTAAAATTGIPIGVAVTTQATPANKVMTLYELPQAVQHDIPPMSISGFTYSDLPQGRMVDINNRLLQEGQYVTDGLKLEQITPDGLIFSYRHYRFRKNLP